MKTDQSVFIRVYLWLIFIGLFTLAVSAISAEVAAACVFELAVAFGADADHVGHDGAGDGLLVVLRLLFARYGAGGVGKILDATDRNHDALGNRLFRRSK